MNKVIPFITKILTAVLLCVFMAACSNGGISDKESHNISQNNEEFHIVISQNTEGAIYGIHYEYYLADTPIGGAEAVAIKNGAAIPIEQGGTISLPFYKQGFPEDANLDTLSVEIYVMDKSGNETKTENDIKLSADYGNNYDFSLTGDTSNYYLSEIEKD